MILAAVPASVARAQGEPTSFEFSFSNPGARSLGLAGAFAGLADDATAAFANPAGLVQLVRPEVSAELRSWSMSIPYVEGGRVEGEPTGIGIDSSAGLHTATSRDTFTGLSHVSFVYPFRRWSLAVFGHRLADFSVRKETQGLFGVGSDVEGSERYLDARGRTDLTIVSAGVAVGVRVSERLSLGMTLVRFSGEVVTSEAEYRVDEPTRDKFFSRNSYFPSRMVSEGSMTAYDGSWGMAMGFLWAAAEDWKVGGFFRQGPALDTDVTVRAGPANYAQLPAGTVLSRDRFRWKFPDVLGIGVSYRPPRGDLTVGFEWDQVRYSSLLRSIDASSIDPSMARLDDGDEVRLGLEYVLLSRMPLVAVRAGAWLDPDHRVHNTGSYVVDRAVSPAVEDELHWSAGLGIAFRRFQVDLGVDLSDLVNTVAVSTIISF